MHSVVVLSTISTAFGLISANAALEDYTYETFIQEYKREFASPLERSTREQIFNKNLEEIRSLNAESEFASFAVNNFADMTEDEISSFRGRADNLYEAPIRLTSSHTHTDELPSYVNWVERGVTTPVKDQASCGSCWAFSAIATIESYTAIHTNKTAPILSTQHLVDCTPNPRECGGSGGCDGATESLGWDYVLSNGGVASEKDYPYKARDGECRASQVKNAVSISGHARLPPNDYDAVLDHLAHKGPLSIGVAANKFSFYSSGILTSCPKGDSNVDINHAVQLVGYGTDEKTKMDYWIIRNSWGSRWGERGFIRVLRNKPTDQDFCGYDKTPQNGSACKDDPKGAVQVCGSCGILSEPAYVIIEGNSIIRA